MHRKYILFIYYLLFIISFSLGTKVLAQNEDYYSSGDGLHFRKRSLEAMRTILKSQGVDGESIDEEWEKTLDETLSSFTKLPMSPGYNSEAIYYFDRDRLERSQVFFVNGHLYQHNSDSSNPKYELLNSGVDPLNTSTGEMFVADNYGNCFRENKIFQMIHHSSFLRGASVIHADMMEVVDGIIRKNTKHSGHYKPTDQTFENFQKMIALSRDVIKKNNSKMKNQFFSDEELMMQLVEINDGNGLKVVREEVGKDSVLYEKIIGYEANLMITSGNGEKLKKFLESIVDTQDIHNKIVVMMKDAFNKKNDFIMMKVLDEYLFAMAKVKKTATAAAGAEKEAAMRVSW